MKLKFNHKVSIFNDSYPLIYLEAIPENETYQFMFEHGWVPYHDVWYQTKSARLKLKPISSKRKRQLSKLNITTETNNLQIKVINDIEAYSDSKYFDFFMDDLFWGRVNFYDNQILYSTSNAITHKNSYGTLSMYYLIDLFKDKYEYLYIADYFEEFSYKSKLPGFEYWNGNEWQSEENQTKSKTN
jgi:hypothetical protein